MRNINEDKIYELSERLKLLSERQSSFSKEIDSLRTEIDNLKNSVNNVESGNFLLNKEDNCKDSVLNESVLTSSEKEFLFKDKEKYSANVADKEKTSLERFIGENLINKLGIIITIVGVAIGAKYSIDNELISPLTRIILGYLVGFGLLALSVRLKLRYRNYSAVLMSGAMAIMYFITYFAYYLYYIIPQPVAFVLMVLFTVFASVAAINYNKQVISLIGLVGAYAVPFLLSTGSGNVAILFSYIIIINIGIFTIMLKKPWLLTQYISFAFSWIIYLWWYVSEYNAIEHITLAFFFAFAFFFIFYAILLIHKLIKGEELPAGNVILFLANSTIFYGVGLSILDSYKIENQLLGAFTIFNSIFNAIIATVIYFKKPESKNIRYLITGLTLIFFTLSIPIQFDGNIVTLIWAGESLVLFWIGRTKGISVYERLSYTFMLLAFGSIINDWDNAYKAKEMMFLLNKNFLSSLLFALSFVFIYKINNNVNYTSSFITNERILRIISYTIPAILIFSIYYAFVVEIKAHFYRLYESSKVYMLQENSMELQYENYKLVEIGKTWIINYTMIFLSVLSFINFKKIKSKQLGNISFILITLSVVVFLIVGLRIISCFNLHLEDIITRYISFALLAATLVACYKYTKQYIKKIIFRMSFSILLQISILCIISSELVFLFNKFNLGESDKLGLSILWGVYSLFLISLGILKKNKFLRFGAIILFAITLVKLFFYDITNLNTISKIIIFLVLGILLLIISFLYNKYKHIILEDDATE